jgi:hypothetical protein
MLVAENCMLMFPVAFWCDLYCELDLKIKWERGGGGLANPGRSKVFFFYRTFQTSFGVHSVSCSLDAGVRSRSKAAEVKNGRPYTSAPHTRLPGVDRERFT